MTLQEFFSVHNKIAIALSGGVDSIFLMYAAKKSGADISAYFARTEFQPETELHDACRAADECGVRLNIISFSALDDERVKENRADRCYFCKKGIMQIIKAMAMSDGYDVICDGTNASDDVEDRPGFRALGELGIISPLRICGMTKDEIRHLAKEMGIFAWDKPSYACLATRIKQGEMLTAEKLTKTEAAEAFLHSLGFSDFRLRNDGNSARLEICSYDMERLVANRKTIVSELSQKYSSVVLELEARDEKLSD